MEIEKPKHVSHWGRFLKKLRAVVIAGLAVTVPIGVIVWIIAWLFDNVDHILQPLIKIIFGHTIIGVGFGVVIVLILIVGLIATNVIGKRIVKWAEGAMERIPVSRILYTAIKQLVQGFAEPNQTGYSRVVLIKYPTKDMRAIAFVTAERTDKEGKRTYTVFIPHAPNPASGVVEIVRAEDAFDTNISIEDAFKMMVSVGRASPSSLADNTNWNELQKMGRQTGQEVNK